MQACAVVTLVQEDRFELPGGHGTRRQFTLAPDPPLGWSELVRCRTNAAARAYRTSRRGRAATAALYGPYSDQRERGAVESAMDRIAQRVNETRDEEHERHQPRHAIGPTSAGFGPRLCTGDASCSLAMPCFASLHTAQEIFIPAVAP